jgi:hypothetical protein
LEQFRKIQIPDYSKLFSPKTWTNLLFSDNKTKLT